MKEVETDTSIIIRNSIAEAKIARHGAHVYSWKVQGEELLFLSSASSISGPTPIRGGIPICFPVFGLPPPREPYSQLKSHGFARNVTWSFEGIEEGNDWAQAKFSLSSKNEEVQKIFKPAFELVYTVKIHQHNLTTTLVVNNPSESSLQVQALFHNYIRLPSQSLPTDVYVQMDNLKGLKFTDKVAKGAVGMEERDQVDFLVGEVDRVYNDVPCKIKLDLGNNKKMTIETHGLPDLTVWNPHEAKSNAMVDMERDGWKKFVCIEPGQTSFVNIEPHDFWKASQELKVHL